MKQRALSQRNALCITEVWEWHSGSFNVRECTYGTWHIKGKVNSIAATLNLKNIILFILHLSNRATFGLNMKYMAKWGFHP